MTEQTSPVPQKAHAAAAQADQPPGKTHSGPSPLDIPARPGAPGAPKPAPRPAPPAHLTGAAPAAAQQPKSQHAPDHPETQATLPQTVTARVTGAQALVMALEQVGAEVVFG